MNKRKKERWNKILKWSGLGACVLIGMIMGLFWFYQDDLPPTSELRNFTLRTGSEVYDANGKMIYLFAFEKRKLVSLKELPPHLIDALLVTEDKYFYSHFGVDIIGNIRAVIIDVVRMDFSQGASTITQQMARNMFLTLDKKVSRKIKEIILALRIERSFTKDEILEIYFNKIFWGGQIHGLETASLYYFGKHARDLNVAESAMLVGMIQRPNYYSPLKNPEAALNRRNSVLKRMYKSKKITEEEYNDAIASPIITDPSGMQRFANDYFIDHIRVQLERKYGTDRLFEGGLKIYTTLDPDLSAYADSTLNKYLTQIENSRGFRIKYSQTSRDAYDIDTRYIQGGLALIENSTGHVKALIGGRNFVHSKFNRMTQARRQPGSSIKPIYYTLAVEKGYTPSTIINDAPLTVGTGEGTWTPKNFSRGYYGYTRMRVALQHSYNVWAVKCAMDIGLDTMSDAFRRFGVGGDVTDFSAALGSYEVVPIKHIAAYTTFPNGGFRVMPLMITKIEDDKGRVLERFSPQRSRVCSEEVAYIMTSMLQSVVSGGTGGQAMQGYHWAAAGKTGTSEDHRDAWFIGFNKRFTLGIWLGFDSNQAMAASGGSSPVATPIWGQIMTRAIRNDNNKRLPKANDERYTFSRPAKIITRQINPRTGFVIDSGGIEEVFIEDNIPQAVSDSLRLNFYPTGYTFQDDFSSDKPKRGQD